MFPGEKAVYWHTQMRFILTSPRKINVQIKKLIFVDVGQGADINAPDKNGWTPLHCASRAGCFEVVKLLTESGASPKSETNLGAAPIWFAASEGHHDVLEYLMTKEHDTYTLMEDRRLTYNTCKHYQHVLFFCLQVCVQSNGMFEKPQQ